MDWLIKTLKSTLKWDRTRKIVGGIICVLLFGCLGAYLLQTGHAAEPIDPTTWAPSGAGTYFFDRSNQTGNAQADYSAREAAFGRKFDGHLYYVPADTTPANLADEHWSLATDKVPFVILSWSSGGNPKNIIPLINQGAYDKDINDFANSVKSQLSPYGNTIIRPFWEFNYTGTEWNDTNYGNDPSQFIAAWQHFVNIFRNDGVTNVKWDWNPNRVNTGQSQDPTPYYPGSNYVDWIGIDAYPKNQFLTLQQLVTMSGGSGPNFDWYDTFKTYGKPLMVGETGIQAASVYGSGAPTRATWWSDTLSALKGPLNQIRAIEYFDANQGIDWMYDAPSSASGDSPSQAMAAVKAAANDCFLNVLATGCGGQQQNPSVSITSPAPSATVGGTVNVNMTVQNSPSKVELYMDNTLLSTATSGPYTYSWNTKGVPDGTHTLVAKAFASNGTAYPSTSVTVTVSNTSTSPTSVSLSSPAAASTVSGTVSLVANVSGTASKVAFLINGTAAKTLTTSPYTYSWNTTNVTNGSYNLQAVAYDASGVAHASASVPVTVSNISSQAIKVNFTAPGAGSTVSGVVPVTVSVTGGSGSDQVKLLLNGNQLKTLTTSPFTYSWDTTALAPGGYTLQADATDASGHAASTVINVQVASVSAPLPPTNLVASNVGTTSLDLSWKAPASGTPVAHYLVYRNNVVVATPTGTSTSDSGLLPGTNYTYAVASVAANGTVSSMSPSLSETTVKAADNQPPTTPANLQASAVSSSQVNLKWSASTDNTAVAGYKVFRNGTQIATTSTTSFGDATVNASTHYVYTVEAFDAAGNVSPQSSQASVTTPAGASPKVNINGATMQYFPNSYLNGKMYDAVVPTIAGDFGNPPLPGAPRSVKTYTLHWVGRLVVPRAGKYTLYLRADQGTNNLFIRGKLFIHDAPSARNGVRSVTLLLQKTQYNFILTYQGPVSNGYVNMSWSGPGLDRQPIPTKDLYPTRSNAGVGKVPVRTY